jgi:hypothetical protein
MKDRFDLENEISFLHTFVDNLGSISEAVLERDLDKDEIVNAVEGVRALLDLHINKLFDTMTQCFNLDQYKNHDN